MNEERTWTGNSEVDAAIVMLDRIDCSPKNDSRIDAVETTLRRLHARVQELEAMLDAVGAGGVSAQRITQVAPQPQEDARDAERPLDRNVMRGDRVWWVVPLRKPGNHEQGFPATVLRAGKVKATIICVMNGTGHWYPQNCRIHDLRPRTEYLAVDVIADTALKRLP